MRKLLTIIVFSTLFVFGTSNVTAQTQKEEENFQKAGQELLATKQANLEATLSRARDAIEGAVSNGKVTSKEMYTLRHIAKTFNLAEANKKLSLYGLKLVPNEEYSKLVFVIETYIKNDGDDKEDSVRKFFAKQTGKDVEVKKSLQGLLPLILLAFCVLISLCFFLVEKVHFNFLFVVCCIAGCFIAFLIILGLLGYIN